ncbi:helix-turn-helix domain-containing protein [Candidatus Sumerlaeota bacterium]|nr:helix-turn-helix domain-containing protein [Candidatus Sumerlaeota bacterium]
MVSSTGGLNGKGVGGRNSRPTADVEQYVAEIEWGKLPPLLAPKRVAELLDLDMRRVYDLVATGDLAGVRHGTRGLRVFRQSLVDWLRRGGSVATKHRETGVSD